MINLEEKKSREEEIEAGRERANSSEYTDEAFIEGARWADANPAPHVLALIRALKFYSYGGASDEDTPDSTGHEARQALAAYHKATKGNES